MKRRRPSGNMSRRQSSPAPGSPRRSSSGKSSSGGSSPVRNGLDLAAKQWSPGSGAVRELFPLEVLQEYGVVSLADLGDLIEHETDLNFAGWVRAHLDHPAQRSEIGGPDDVRRDAIEEDSP